MSELSIGWPLWVLAADVAGTGGGEWQILGGEVEGRPAAFLFTREETARALLAAHPQLGAGGYAPAVVRDGQALLALLEALERAGYTQAAFDPSGGQASAVAFSRLRSVIRDAAERAAGDGSPADA